MMKIKLSYSESCDINYVARFITLRESDLEPHPNAERLMIAKVLGFRVIVNKDTVPGEYIYFPVGSQISGSFLSCTSNYCDQSKNKDQTVSGTFENTGRVKAIKLRGVLSEGWLCDIKDLEFWISELAETSDFDLDYGTGSFDTVVLGKNRVAWLCKKYIIKGEPDKKKQRLRGKVPGRLFEIIPKDQFRFHYETEQLKYYPEAIKPGSYIWITKKIDGTYGISSYTQIKRKWYEFWKPKRYYHRLYASSGVIKSKEVNTNAGPGWYGVDIWKEADNVVGPLLNRGMTAYYEIVGYLPTGEFIQKEDDFGCVKPGTKFIINLNFKVKIYRLTFTTPEGTVFELNPRQVKDWTDKVGLESVKILYEGLAKDLYSDLDPSLHWSENFLGRLKKDRNLGMEELEDECKNKVPQEGIVIRVGDKAYKLKTEAHLIWKQEWIDKGVSDIEDLENRNGQ